MQSPYGDAEPVPRKKRCTFMIEPELLERLRSVKLRTGLSEGEQIRQGIRWWLESREWPVRARAGGAGAGGRRSGPARR